mgnify:CR=1 FL=1
MNFGFQGYQPDQSIDNDNNSISRYLSTNSTTENSNSLGVNFSDILNSQLDLQSPIDQKLDISLQRLENNQALLNTTPEQLAENIFSTIDKILSGVYEVFGNKFGNSAPSLSENSADLDRLLSGVKQLFDKFEIPFVLEELGNIWKKLKQKNSPDFHMVHSYFLHISISFLSLEPTDQISDDGYEKNCYSDETYRTLLLILETFPDNAEKQEIEDVLNVIPEYNSTDRNDHMSELLGDE